MAVHVYGCRVLQRLIEHCSREPQLIELVDSLLGNTDNVEKLLKDLFGSNVLRALLVHGTTSHVKAAQDAKQSFFHMMSFDAYSFSTATSLPAVFEAILDVLGTNVLKFAKHKCRP